MRLLIGPRPAVDVFKVIILALEGEGAGLGPGLHDEIVRLLEALVGFRRVHAGGIILGPDAAHEAGDEAAGGDVVEHGEFFGDHERIVEQRQRAAEHGDLAARRAARERAGHDARDRHQAIGVLVVLVHAHAVEAGGVGEFELVEIAVVKLVADLRIVIGIGQSHPGGVVLLVVVGIERRIGHEMEGEEFHLPTSCANATTLPTHSSMRSVCGTCPQSLMTSSFEPGISFW